MKKYKSDNLPEEMRAIINNLKKSKSKLDCLHKTYDVMTAQFHGYRFRTLLNLFNLFVFDPNRLWYKTRYPLCTNMCYLTKILLTKSGFFQEQEVKYKWTLVWLVSPHQYLRVKINDEQYINIDIWAKDHGIKFGDYAHGFH